MTKHGNQIWQILKIEYFSLFFLFSRETHKIAIIYIGPGQQDKNTILSNEIGSEDYEEFLNSIAWTVIISLVFLIRWETLKCIF